MTDPYAKRIAVGQPFNYRVLKATNASQYQWIQDIADSFAPAVRRAFLAAVQKMKDNVAIETLRAAIAAGNVNDAMAALGIDTTMPHAIAVEMQQTLEDEYIAAGRAAAVNTLPKNIAATARFDISNPASVRFLNSYNLRLITGITDPTRDAIRGALLRSFEFGGNPLQTAREIRGYIGLTPQYVGAVQNYKAALALEQRAPDQIIRMTEKYQERLLRVRSETIARTETIRAASAGQQAAWHQARDQGLIDTSARRQWIVTPDDKLCIYCASIPILNPTGASLDGYFASALGPIDFPPLHPNCRCAVSLDDA